MKQATIKFSTIEKAVDTLYYNPKDFNEVSSKEIIQCTREDIEVCIQKLMAKAGVKILTI